MTNCDNGNDIDAKQNQQQPADESPYWQGQALTLDEMNTLLSAFQRVRGERGCTLKEVKTVLFHVDAIKLQCQEWEAGCRHAIVWASGRG